MSSAVSYLSRSNQVFAVEGAVGAGAPRVRKGTRSSDDGVPLAIYAVPVV